MGGQQFPLGRKTPTDWKHVERYPLAAVLPTAPAAVERVLTLPPYRAWYDQGQTSACVGYSASWLMSILNCRPSDGHKYDAKWLWEQAKAVDEWPDTNPGDNNGSSVRAAMDVLRQQGHVRVRYGVDKPCDPAEGIAANRWATSVDQIRAAIASGVPVNVGTSWYEGMFQPEQRKREWWLPDGNLGQLAGGHAWVIYGASDARQAFKGTSSWGTAFPLFWVSYALLGRLLGESGEAAVVTDK